jgi:CTP:phosphocholine cytidylyltransferase involved in choline phosphorylation for cell surface LPS epitopes
MYCTQYNEGLTRTERGVVTDKYGLIISTEKPCSDAWTVQGHAYFDSDFSRKFKVLLEEYYYKPGVENMYWEGIWAENLDLLHMYAVKCSKDDILEFDSVEDLRAFDPDYITHNDIKVVDNICRVLNTKPKDIINVIPISAGITNKSFIFSCDGKKYVYRNPGKNTKGLIDRKRETFALNVAKDLGIDSSFLYENDLEGWKISKYIETNEPFNFYKSSHIKMLSEHLHKLQDASIFSNSKFDFYEEADRLIGIIRSFDSTTADTFIELREKIVAAHTIIENDNWPHTLCHNDIYEPNLLVSRNELYLIDWEYAGDSDIGYDICKLFATKEMNRAQVIENLSIFYKRKPNNKELIHLYACASITNYYWYVWSVFETKSGNDCTKWQMEWYDKANKYFNEMISLQEDN